MTSDLLLFVINHFQRNYSFDFHAAENNILIRVRQSWCNSHCNIGYIGYCNSIGSQLVTHAPQSDRLLPISLTIKYSFSGAIGSLHYYWVVYMILLHTIYYCLYDKRWDIFTEICINTWATSLNIHWELPSLERNKTTWPEYSNWHELKWSLISA